jgi:hypothetical protein
MSEHDLAREVRAEMRTILAMMWIERIVRWIPAAVVVAAVVALLLWGAR